MTDARTTRDVRGQLSVAKRPAKGAGAVGDFRRRVAARAAGARLTELFRRPPPGTLYHVADRQGVSVVVVPTSALGEAELEALLDFRFANYLEAGIVDAEDCARRGIEAEDPALVGAEDLHCVAAAAGTGELLCYCLISPIALDLPHATLRSRVRPLSYPEHYAGWGIFNRLPLLPDLPLDRVWQLGRIMKNLARHDVDDLGARGPVEVCVAAYHVLVTSLRPRIDATVMGFEDQGAARNFAFFHAPMVILPGGIWVDDPEDLAGRYVASRNFRAAAMLVADLGPVNAHRVERIEAALALEGEAALDALFELHRASSVVASRLQPGAGLEPLSNAADVQMRFDYAGRLQLRHMGRRLGGWPIFASLSEAEARTLAAHLVPADLPPGVAVPAGGGALDGLYLVLDGTIALRVLSGRGGRAIRCGPGSAFGEESLLGGQVWYQPVTTTRVRLLRLDPADFHRFLAHRDAVRLAATQAVLRRLQVHAAVAA
jgi:hypothetical protein